MAKDDPNIIAQAKRRFAVCEERERDTRALAIEDIKFARGDADNGWQWAKEESQRRTAGALARPMLTINKVRQHNLQIINDMKQNTPSAKVIPAGGETTYEAAQVMNGIIRHIEYQSDAKAQYENAYEDAVEGGIGYWRIVTDYEDDESFDQDIFIRGVKDPMSVYYDPDIKEPDGSDCRFAFVFEDMSKEKFEDCYPEYTDIAHNAPFGKTQWINKDNIRIAEYYYTEETKDTIARIDDTTVYLSDIEDTALRQLIRENKDIPKRRVKRKSVKWCKIIGDTIVEKRDIPGKYIPVVRVVGEEVEIAGIYDRKGHTRCMKDPQRVYNYWTSAAVEFVALQTKSPYLVDVNSVDGLENYWANANTENSAYLPYRSYDEHGTALPSPTRIAPPQFSAAYIQGMQISSQELKDVSGQQDAKMGAQTEEISGVAIARRQAQADNATYGFINNLARAIRLTGKIIIDIAPKIYDTKRVIRILGEDGTESRVTVDPEAPQAHQEQEIEYDKIETIFNPGLGKFDVMADIGADFATRRQETAAALSQIMAQNPQITGVAGDLLFKSYDFYLADEIAERLSRTIPEAIKSDKSSPEMQNLQQQIQQSQMISQQLMQQLAEEKRKRDVDVYKAQTDRIKAYGENMSPEAMAVLIAQTVVNTLKSPLTNEESNTGDGPAMPAGGGLSPE